MPNQPDVEIDIGNYWWIDPPHMLQAARFWKRKGHPCLNAITFSDLLDIPRFNFWWDTQERDRREEKVARSWKNLTMKPYALLKKYHKNFVKENDISSEEDMRRKFPVIRNSCKYFFE